MYAAAFSHTPAAFRSIRHAAACSLVISALGFLGGCSGTTTNPPTAVPSQDTPSTMVSSNPQDQILEHSCFDCHSERNMVSWNVHLTPSYVFGASKARQALDLSAWPDYSASRKHAEMAAITQVIEDGSMPPGDYALLHPSASPSDQQRRIVLQWAASRLPPVAP